MKTIILLTIFTILQASANTLAQNITLSEKNAPLKKVFQDISHQSGFEFIASNSVLAIAKPVTIQVKEEVLEKVLSEIFADQPLLYTVQEKIVVVSKKPNKPVITNSSLVVPIIISGKVVDSLGNPLPGSTLKNLSNGNIQTTNSDGGFKIQANIGDQILVTFIGYKSFTFIINEPNSNLVIKLMAGTSKLEEVVVISTGYQVIPKERTTGSFDLIDSTLLNRNTSTSILDRLDGVTSGLIFNKSLGNGNNPTISIRGRNTIYANPDPLIVVDSFPYDGDLSNINPNDIQNISILKDAAAASIWGVRAGNGVIVITTKKGKLNRSPQVSFNSNTTISQRPNLFYQPQMNSSDFIDLEQYLFRKGYYNTAIADGYSVISPAVALFLQKQNGTITATDSAKQINQLKSYDVRNDLSKFVYRPSVNQQYSLSITGGGKSNIYYISAGYDNNKENTSGNSYSRVTITANNSLYFFNDKLKIDAGIAIASSITKGNTNTFSTAYPYQRLADKDGNHLAVLQATGLRKQFTDTAGNGKLLDWNYRPLDENGSNNTTNLTDYKLTTNIRYLLVKGLNFQINYQYQKGLSDYTLLNSINSFYTRNLINSYSQIDPSSGTLTRAIPYGGIESISNSGYTSNSGRAQLNFEQNYGQTHAINLLAGIEIKDYNSTSISNTMYGFDPSTASSLPVDYITYFTQYYGFNSNTIPYGGAQNFTIDRIRSAFFNGSYTYNNKYTVSLSARHDESNIFGVSSNQKGVPLWSSGLLWNLSKESFYHSSLFPVLKLRLTYGYNGNVDKTTSAYLTAQDVGPNSWNTEYTNIVNPPNPSLRWEKDRNINVGVDFSTKNNLISGSFEYYLKNGTDLIANSPIAPQTGIVQFKGNAADTKTNGFDFTLNKNVTGNTKISWQSNLILSYSKDIITNYKVKQPNNAQIIISNYVNPLEGFPYNAIFSYPFRGLDGQGRPQGQLNGQISENYAAILSSTNSSELVYNGSRSPLYFGSLRNTFGYKDFELSFNIIFKFDYYFRRPNVFSGSNYGSYMYLEADFDKRWQRPGDELKTIIPALTYPNNSAADGFFSGSSALVEKADNVRLQDIRLSYRFNSNTGNTLIRNLKLTAYLNNVGLLWKATKVSLDPDYLYTNFVAPRTISLGVSTHF